MEITDVTTIDQLSDAEVDELLARALNPQTPIEIFYAVLDRIGGIPAAAAPDAGSVPDPAPTATDPDPEPDPVPAEVGSEA
jgi:hypothetical protein